VARSFGRSLSGLFDVPLLITLRVAAVFFRYPLAYRPKCAHQAANTASLLPGCGVVYRERPSRRSVDGRREEPAARRRSTDGIRFRALSAFSRCGRASRASPRSPRRASSCTGSAVHDLTAVCRLLRPIDQPFRSAQDERQTSAFVKALQSISQRRFSRTIVGLSSRGSSSNEALTSFTRCTAGRVSPHASLVDYNLTRVETGRVSHDALLERPRLAQPLPLASRHHRPEPRRKTAVQKSRLRPNAVGASTRERPRYPSDPKRVWMLEAPGDAPPLPPSGWARVANGSTVTKPGPRLFSARRVARG
jgi:hypothetical protein